MTVMYVSCDKEPRKKNEMKPNIVIFKWFQYSTEREENKL